MPNTSFFKHTLTIAATLLAPLSALALEADYLNANPDTNSDYTIYAPGAPITAAEESDDFTTTAEVKGLKYHLTPANTATVLGFADGYEFSDLDIPNEIHVEDEIYRVTAIDDEAFRFKSVITSVRLPEHLNYWSPYTFMGCYNISSVKVDSHNYAFMSIDGVLYMFEGGEVYYDKPRYDPEYLLFYPSGKSDEHFIVPDHVKTIWTNAFFGCQKLQKITIPSSVKSIGRAAFNSCSNLSQVLLPNGLTYLADNLFLSCEALKSITIPNTVQVIDFWAFAFTGLTSINIPASVSKISSGAFPGCEDLTEIKVSRDNQYLCDIDGVVYNKAKNKLILYPEGKPGEDYTVAEGVKTMDKWAFSDASLKSVDLPKSMVDVGYRAFVGSEITEVTCRAITPPKAEDLLCDPEIWALKTLYVPEESVDVYKATEPWNLFETILPIGSDAAIDAPLTRDSEPNEIYDLQGRRITKATRPGVYIIDGQKTIVR